MWGCWELRQKFRSNMAEPEAQNQAVASDPERLPNVARAGTAAPPKRPTFWEILNSQLVLWLLGSVVLSGISYFWNRSNDARSQKQAEKQKEIDNRREDSQFLGTMIPYLTSPVADVRLRAVQVITSRYKDPTSKDPNDNDNERKLPPDVAQIIGKAVGADLAPGQSQQTQETKNLVASVGSQLPARIYLQIFGEAERAKAKEIQSLLRAQGWLAPGIENVAGKATPVTKTFVRYFNDSDKATADQIGEKLKENGFPQTSVEKSPLKANPGTIEVWFPGTS